jgi:hypothetical protein
MDYSKVLEYLRGASGKAVYIILNKWYWVVAGPALYVTYNFLVGVGVPLDQVFSDLSKTLAKTVELSKLCPNKIGNLQAFFRCLNDGQ